MKADIIVIGAGASGLAAAICAARGGAEVLILEKMNKPGKKILATGNGRCNFTNAKMAPSYFRGHDDQLIKAVLEHYDTQKILKFFEELGIYPKLKEGGYYYPNSMQASAILQVLLDEAERLGVKILLEQKVRSIEKTKKGFKVVTEASRHEAAKVILSTGGKAYQKLGSDGSGYTLAKALGHHIRAVQPALTGLKCKGRFYKAIAGVRVQAGVTLVSGEDKVLACDEGELQLTAYGISGIPVFQVSRYGAYALSAGEKVTAVLDFMPSMTEQELEQFLINRKNRQVERCDHFLIGLLPEKLIHLLLQAAAIDDDDTTDHVSDEKIHRLTMRIKSFRTEVLEPNTFDEAQVCAGGVATEEIDAYTMMSKKVPGIYMTGELLDVDGICGGYNLHFAWATGMIAGTSAISK